MKFFNTIIHKLSSIFPAMRGKTFMEEGGYSEIWKVAYPLIIMSASHTVMQFCDRKFLSMNSTEDVAAALPAGILCFTMFCFFMVTTNFTSAIVAQLYGAGRYNSCVRAAWTGFYFSLGASALIAFVMPLIGIAVIEYGNHTAAIMSREKDYFEILMPGGSFICIGAAFFAFFAGRGKTMYIAVVNMASCLLNIVLDYIMIFGKLGLPALGITGAGLATTLSALFSCLCAFTMFIFVDQQQFPTRKKYRIDFASLKRLLSFGTPAGLQTFFDVAAFTMITFIIGKINPSALAATTIALSINQICFLPLLGISDATSIVTGQYIGKNRKNIAEKCAGNAWRMAALYMLAAGLIYLLLPDLLINFFAPQNKTAIDFQGLVKDCRILLLLAAFYNFFDATKFIFMGALKGAGDTRAVLGISLSCSWLIMVPGVLITTFVLNGSIIQVWLFLSCYVMFESMMMLWRFRSKAWQKIDLIKQDA